MAITLASMLVLSSCGSSEQVKKETTDISQTKEEARYESKEMSLPDLWRAQMRLPAIIWEPLLKALWQIFKENRAVYSSVLRWKDDEYKHDKQMDTR